jgi:hypothetical protein
MDGAKGEMWWKMELRDEVGMMPTLVDHRTEYNNFEHHSSCCWSTAQDVDNLLRLQRLEEATA